jgi:hypothetical protein
LQQIGITTLTTRPRYRRSSMLIALCLLGHPVSSLTWTRGNGQNTLDRGTLRIQVHVGTNMKPGRGRGIRWSWTRFSVERVKALCLVLVISDNA